jgi:hypothetical protein
MVFFFISVIDIWQAAVVLPYGGGRIVLFLSRIRNLRVKCHLSINRPFEANQAKMLMFIDLPFFSFPLFPGPSESPI